MIDVKDAVKIGVDHLMDLLPNSTHPMLEEAELSDDERFWYITISVSVPAELTNQKSPALITPFSDTRRRVYKILTINAQTGQVKSMKIREVH
jgi:hypothetical protein